MGLNSGGKPSSIWSFDQSPFEKRKEKGRKGEGEGKGGKGRKEGE